MTETKELNVRMKWLKSEYNGELYPHMAFLFASNNKKHYENNSVVYRVVYRMVDGEMQFRMKHTVPDVHFVTVPNLCIASEEELFQAELVWDHEYEITFPMMQFIQKKILQMLPMYDIEHDEVFTMEVPV